MANRMKGFVSSLMGSFNGSAPSHESVGDETSQESKNTPIQPKATEARKAGIHQSQQEPVRRKTAYPPENPSGGMNKPRRAVASARKVTPVESSVNCRKYLILNGKGGCGKTTISTNLASYFAANGYKTAIMDYDPQESSLTWLKLRQAESQDSPFIHGIAAHQGAGGLVTRSWQLRTPPGTERVVIDAPAGTSGAELIEILQNVNAIVIPVLPSSIDMHATARFVQDLLLVGKVRARNLPVCIVANRVPRQTSAYKKLLLFLSALNIPFVVKFKDNHHYLNAAEKGLGIHELQTNSTISYEIQQWKKLTGWLECAGMGKAQAKTLSKNR